MRSERNFKQKIILTLLLAVSILEGISLILFNRIDSIINTDLYNYGLRFSPVWATRYWNTSYLYQELLVITIIIVGLSMLVLLLPVKMHQTASKAVSLFLVATATIIIIFSLHLFYNLDYLVNNDLYSYGLQFSPGWIPNYWTYAHSTVSIAIIIVIMMLASIILLISGKRKAKLSPTKLTYSLLLTLGAVSLVISIIYASSILAFIGLGLVFWGIVVTYIKTEEFVKKSIMNSTISSQQLAISQVLKQIEFKGKPVYLPPKYFTNPETSKAYIAREKDFQLPSFELIQKEENHLLTTDSLGVLLVPSGAGLAKLFEKTLETNFTMVDLEYLEQKLPKLIVDSLEIAQTFKMKVESKKIDVKITNSIYSDLYPKDDPGANSYLSITFPLSSAIACSLTKAIGQPIRIERLEISRGGRDLTVEYAILEETR